MSGSSHGSPVGDCTGSRSTSLEPAASATGERSREAVLVRVALVEDARGQRVRREDDVRSRAAEAVRQSSTSAGSSCQLSTKSELRAVGERLLQLRAVAADRQPRVVRREHEPDDRLGPAGERGLGRVRDARRPVLHPGEHGQPELVLERSPRLLGDLVQRVRVLDPEPPVALGQFLEQLGPNRPPAANVRVVGRHVLDPLGDP